MFCLITVLVGVSNLRHNSVTVKFLLQIITKRDRSLTLNLRYTNGIRGSGNKGTLTVRADETVTSRNAIELKFRCSALENKDTFSTSVSIFRSIVLELVNCHFKCLVSLIFL